MSGGDGTLGEEDGEDRGDVRNGLLLADEPLEDKDNLDSNGANLIGELGERGDLIGGGTVLVGGEMDVFVLAVVTLQGGVVRTGEDKEFLNVGGDVLYISVEAVVTGKGLRDDVERFVVRKGLNEQFLVGLFGEEGDFGGVFGEVFINLQLDSCSKGAKLNCDGLLYCWDLGPSILALTGSTSGRTICAFSKSSLLSHFCDKRLSFLFGFSFMDALRSMLVLFWFFSLLDIVKGHAGSLEFALLLSQLTSDEIACPLGDMVRL